MDNIENGIIYLGFNNPLKYKRGVENVILFQSEALKSGCDKIYIFFGDKNEEFYWNDIKCISIKHNILRFFSLNILLKKLLSRRSYIIHSHNYLMAFFLMRKTDIFTVHDGLYYHANKTKHKFKMLFKWIEIKTYQKSKLIHFISKFTKNNSLYQGSNFQIIYNTTPLEKVAMDSQNKTLFLENKVKIFSVRSIEERAYIDLLIDLADKNINYDIKIAGKGPLLEMYNNIISEKRIANIELLGYVSDEMVKMYYDSTDVVVILAKYGEGFGLPIIEGYLHNKPVFASNTCAIPEVIFNEDFLVENNLESIENKLKKYFFETKNNELEYNFFEYYNNNFSYGKILNEYKKLYNKFGL